MTPEKIVSVLELYERRLIAEHVQKRRMPPALTVSDLGPSEVLAHVHYLIDGAKEYARDPEKIGKANRHLGAIQMLLSLADWYTLEELMAHNRPSEGAEP